MKIMEIRKAGDKVLKMKAEPVEKVTGKIKHLMDDMLETMYMEEGVGLAAPQVGVSLRVIVLDIGDGKAWKLANPVIEKAEGKVTALEGCLSVPGFCGNVERFEQVVVSALDRQGKKVKIKADGLLARALQHEIDHLEGILFIEKAIDLKEMREESNEK